MTTSTVDCTENILELLSTSHIPLIDKTQKADAICMIIIVNQSINYLINYLITRLTADPTRSRKA